MYLVMNNECGSNANSDLTTDSNDYDNGNDHMCVISYVMSGQVVTCHVPGQIRSYQIM